MDAIFQYNNDYMNEPFKMYDSYMERASLQLKLELEEYVESTLASSSLFIEESAKDFIDKFKKAIADIIERLRTFINDLKRAKEKYNSDKELERKIDMLASFVNKSDELAKMKVKYQDYTPKAQYIKNKKKAFDDLFRKKSTGKEELEHFMDKYRRQMSDIDKAKVAGTVIAISAIATKGFISGIISGVNEAIEESSMSVEQIHDLTIDYNYKSKLLTESSETKPDEVLSSEAAMLMTIYARMAAEITSDELKTAREQLAYIDRFLDDTIKLAKETVKDEN